MFRQISKNLYVCASIILGIVTSFSSANAAQNLTLECNVSENITHYNSLTVAEKKENKTKVLRKKVTVTDDGSVFIGSRENCNLNEDDVVCKDEGTFEDIVKNEKRRKIDTFIRLNRNSGKTHYYTIVEILIKNRAGEGWDLFRTTVEGEGYCKEVETKKLF